MDPDQTIQTLVKERDELKQHCARLQALTENLGYPPGHFYSPVVDVQDRHAAEAVRGRTIAPLPAGVAIDVEQMKAKMKRLAEHHHQFRFPRNQENNYRYYFDNPFFGCHDASVLFSMLLEYKPRRVVEVGCGHSSRLLLDTNEKYLQGKLDLTFIDPFLNTQDEMFGQLNLPTVRMFSQPVQDVTRDVFARLEKNDILFVDSSHVVKTGSDVNHVLFQILPMLQPGVLIHFHDILYPFEYLEEWILTEKRSWNEAYVLHAFLQYNSTFEIVYWNNFVSHRLRDELSQSMPLCLENEGGSIWLKRVR